MKFCRPNRIHPLSLVSSSIEVFHAEAPIVFVGNKFTLHKGTLRKLGEWRSSGLGSKDWIVNTKVYRLNIMDEKHNLLSSEF